MIEHVPLNIDPIAPSLLNALVPLPVAFSPAAGCGVSVTLASMIGLSKYYNLLGRLMDAARQLVLFQRGIGALLKRLC